MTMRKIDPSPFAALAGSSKPELGPAPMLKWIDVSDLMIDPAYQRDILRTGSKNIIAIAREFDWTKFSPVIVAPLEGGKFVLVDGQHRTMAAAIWGIKKVPAQIIVADRKKQAAAFAAINAVTTEMSPMQVHAAKMVAGDREANQLAKLCAEAGVIILRYPIQTKNQKLGETMAVGALYRALRKFGPDVLTTALSCITRTRDGYPGLVRSQLVMAFCVVLEAEPDWIEHRRLLKAVGALDLREAFANAGKAAAAGSSGGLVAALVDILGDHLEKQLAGPKK
jgi:ParB/Sulfiredoxin domain